MDNLLPIGTAAPHFNLNATPDQGIQLENLLGSKVVLLFYPADWSPVCTDQLALYNEALDYFKKYHSIVIGISVDGIWSHHAFSIQRNLHFPLLSDFEPKGRVSKMYRVYNDVAGVSRRALYVIDEKGIVRWHQVTPDGLNPGVNEVLAALEIIDKKNYFNV